MTGEERPTLDDALRRMRPPMPFTVRFHVCQQAQEALGLPEFVPLWSFFWGYVDDEEYVGNGPGWPVFLLFGPAGLPLGTGHVVEDDIPDWARASVVAEVQVQLGPVFRAAPWTLN